MRTARDESDWPEATSQPLVVSKPLGLLSERDPKEELNNPKNYNTYPTGGKRTTSMTHDSGNIGLILMNGHAYMYLLSLKEAAGQRQRQRQNHSPDGVHSTNCYSPRVGSDGAAIGSEGKEVGRVQGRKT